MKASRQRIIMLLLLCVVGIAIMLMGNAYFRYVSQRVYEENTNNLVEVYSQVNNSFRTFLRKNWGDLNDWSDYIQTADDESVFSYINGRQEYWGFSRFYFLSEDGSCITLDGTEDYLDLEENLERLVGQGEYIMTDDLLPDGQSSTVFAIPVQAGTYKGFDYKAIALSYTNADIIRSLNVDAFSGQSKCFVIYTDGSVLLSTHQGGSVFSNYLTYLRAGSDMDEEQLNRLSHDWEEGIAGVIRCQIGGENHYVSYLPVGYQNCILLGVVPEAAASVCQRQIQKATIDVLTKVFLLVSILMAAEFIYYSRRQTRKNALELEYRELMFSALSNNVEDIFIMLNNETWKVDYISPNVERLLGIPQEAAANDIRLLGENIVKADNFISKEDFDAIPVQGSRSWEHEHVHQRTGERRWYRETIYHESIQGTEKFIVVMSDRTQERQMNENLQEALEAAESANKAKSHFLSNMSHDIRTPMNAIIGFTVLLAKDAEQAEKVREYTRKISASSQHLLSLINDVLDMSKIESGKTTLNLAQFSLPELIEELYTILLPQAKAKKQSFEFHTQGRLAEQLMGDKLRLNQILINLLSNSIKYTLDGGKIDFMVQELSPLSPKYARLRFVVQDNGIGMSEEFQRNVFSPFEREVNSTTSGIQGTGLGMAITKNLVELMGGTIQVSSQLGQGSIFTVELSFALPERDGEEEIWSRYGISRVLVVDDEEEICRDIQNMMRDTGVEVSYATEGAAAVEAAFSAHEQERDFHVILLDWKMPEQSGVETARQIRKKIPRNIPILVLTSYDWSEIEDEAREAGIDAFMPKPFFVSTFRQTLESLQSDRMRKKRQIDGMNENVLEGLLFLVAEDNELNAEILSEMLKMEGAACELAVNGQEAVEMFVRSEPDYYDMILMDVQMPVMNGYEATRQIRACKHPRAGRIPIVAMTANAFAEDVRNALDSGMNGHLAKPIDMEVVKALLGRLKENAQPISDMEEGGYAE